MGATAPAVTPVIPGIGERVAGQCLQQIARNSKARARDCGRQASRQPQGPDQDRLDLAVGGKEHTKYRLDGKRLRPGQQPDEDDQQSRGDEEPNGYR